MTIQEFAAMLDDYTGHLVQTVQKLEIERSRGTLNLDEQLDLVGDLREVVRSQRIRPWGRKALLGLIPGMVLAMLLSLATKLSWTPLLRFGVGIIGGGLFLWGLYGLWKMLAFRKLECGWLRAVEEHLRRGGTVFDAPER
jgi:hypothetical protein